MKQETMDTLLSVHELSVARGGLSILCDVSFDLFPGQALVLRGRNGIGKTTLLRCLAGLQPVLNGTIDVGADAIAYASHADGIKSMLSVAENLRFWAQVFGTTDIETALVAFDLVALRDRMAGTLSAGQKRRLSLARLVVSGRPIWALDEPTVSLDQASCLLFAQAVQTHLDAAGAAIIATHIDLGVNGQVLQLDPYAATSNTGVPSGFDEAFL